MSIRWTDIPRLTPAPGYHVDVSWGYFEDMLADFERDGYILELEPDFQRQHVWDDERRIKYVEFCLQGGESARRLFFNCPAFGHREGEGAEDPMRMVLVDGLQRMTSVRKFLANELPVFGGHYLDDFEDKAVMMRGTRLRFEVHINDLPTRAAVLNWYLEINAGGIAHTPQEIERVRALLAQEQARKGGLDLALE